MTKQDKQERIRKVVDEFHFDILEEYKTIIEKIRQESGVLGIFKKKQYDKHIKKLTVLRRRVNGMDIDSIPQKDRLTEEICKLLKNCLKEFDSLAGAQITMQIKLQQKANGDKSIKMSDCTPWLKVINDTTTSMNAAIRKLDIRWADYLEING